MHVMTPADQLEQLAALTPITLTLFHWDKPEYNLQWIANSRSDQELQNHMTFVASQSSTQAQGKGLYLTPRPEAYTAKAKATDTILIVTVTLVPYLDASSDPMAGSALHAIAPTKNLILNIVDGNGNPPKILLKYGGYYRLTTATNVQMTVDLSTVHPNVLDQWRTSLWQQFDKNAFNALKAQAQSHGVDVSNW